MIKKLLSRDYWIIKHSGLFDAEYYLRTYPDVRQTDIDPVWHYCKYGWREGRNPSVQFDTNFYLSTYSDVKEASVNPLVHYIKHGKNENRNRKPNCNLSIRRLNYHNFNDGAKIIVHVHLYYEDILGEIIEHLLNLEHSYDLYITLPNASSSDPDMLKNRLRCDLSYVSKIEVIKTENRGRDIAPLLVNLRTVVAEYDFLLHIHTKKSLYSGCQQDTWRQHLYSGLLGSKDLVDKIILLLKESNIGYVSPSTYKDMPYWAHAWLCNRASAEVLSRKLGIDIDTTKYADFSVGTMFWCKIDAIRQLFSAKFILEDFPIEPIPNDGTIMHALERVYGELVASNNFDYAEIDYENKNYCVGKATKNLHQYWQLTFDSLRFFVDNKKLVSIDIFDTLVGRMLLNPDSLFHIIDSRLSSDLRGKIEDFYSIRKMAEENCRKRVSHNQDITIYDIYDEIANVASLSQSERLKLLETEVLYEKMFIKPRNGMQSLVGKILDSGSKIILTSDMYLTEIEIKEILASYFDIDKLEIRVSSSTGLRKDRGDYWDMYKSEIDCHIGDNEHSDIQLCVDRGIPCFHVMSPSRMLELSVDTKLNTSVLTPEDSIILGISMFKLFSNPFALSRSNGKIYYEDPVLFGYTVFGPIFFHFIIFLIKKLNELDLRQVCFFSREGYFLEKLFAKYYDNFACQQRPTHIYLEISRRSAVMASIKNEHDIYETLNIYYSGSLENLLSSRYDIYTTDKEYEQIIELPRDKEYTFSVVSRFTNEILSKAFAECEAYLKYYQSVIPKTIGNMAVVDIGFAGTIQKYLSKITNEESIGLYMMTKDEVVKNKLTAFGCFCENITGGSENIMLDNSQLLESIMTAPDGQLINFTVDKSGFPVANYREHALHRSEFNTITSIWGGIDEYIADCTKIHSCGKLPSVEASTFFFREFLYSGCSASDEIKKIFRVDDSFVSNSILKPLS